MSHDLFNPLAIRGKLSIETFLEDPSALTFPSCVVSSPAASSSVARSPFRRLSSTRCRNLPSTTLATRLLYAKGPARSRDEGGRLTKTTQSPPGTPCDIPATREAVWTFLQTAVDRSSRWAASFPPLLPPALSTPYHMHVCPLLHPSAAEAAALASISVGYLCQQSLVSHTVVVLHDWAQFF